MRRGAAEDDARVRMLAGGGCTDAQARAVMHAMASEVADSVVDAVSRAANAAVTANTAHVAVSVGARADRLRFFGSVDEAVELVDALRSDARVSAAISATSRAEQARRRHRPSARPTTCACRSVGHRLSDAS